MAKKVPIDKRLRALNEKLRDLAKQAPRDVEAIDTIVDYRTRQHLRALTLTSLEASLEYIIAASFVLLKKGIAADIQTMADELLRLKFKELISLIGTSGDPLMTERKHRAPKKKRREG